MIKINPIFSLFNIEVINAPINENPIPQTPININIKKQLIL